MSLSFNTAKIKARANKREKIKASLAFIFAVFRFASPAHCIEFAFFRLHEHVVFSSSRGENWFAALYKHCHFENAKSLVGNDHARDQYLH